MTGSTISGLARQVHRHLVEIAVDDATGDLATEAERHLRALAPLLPRDEREQVLGAALAQAQGLGPLEPLLADPTVTEILVNAGTRGVGRAAPAVSSGSPSSPTGAAELLIERIIGPLGLRVDRLRPDRRRSAGRRLPLPRRHPTGRHRRSVSRRPPVRGADPPAEQLRRSARGGAARGAGRAAGQPGRERRHLVRQDDAPQRAAGVGSPRRAHPHDRGRGRAPAGHPARRPARSPAPDGRGRGRGDGAGSRARRLCGSGRTGWSSARSEGPRPSTWSWPSTPGTTAR